MNSFEYLMLAHLILDYPLQGDFLGLGKSKYTFLLLVHVLMWSLGIGATLQWLGMFAPWKLQMLFWGHLVMDYLKCRNILSTWLTKLWYVLPKSATKPPEWWTDNLGLSLWIDQAFHILQLILCLV